MRWKEITKQGDGSWIGYRTHIGPLELTVTCDASGGNWDGTATFKHGKDYTDIFWLKGFPNQNTAQRAIVERCRTMFLKTAQALKKVSK